MYTSKTEHMIFSTLTFTVTTLHQDLSIFLLILLSKWHYHLHKSSSQNLMNHPSLLLFLTVCSQYIGKFSGFHLQDRTLFQPLLTSSIIIILIQATVIFHLNNQNHLLTCPLLSDTFSPCQSTFQGTARMIYKDVNTIIHSPALRLPVASPHVHAQLLSHV